MPSNAASLTASVLAMSAFAFTGAVTPGPVNVLALRHGLQARRQSAILFVLGASLSYTLVVWVTGLGMIEHLPIHPQAAPAARWLCAAYLLWLAWRLTTAGTNSWHMPDDAHASASAAAAFREGVLTQTLNPKAWLFAMSAVGVFVLQHPAAAPQALGLLCAISLVACSVGVGAWAMAGRLLLGRLPSGASKHLNQALALLLATSVLGMLL